MRELWCKFMHGRRNLMHPIQGRYICRKCQCSFPVTWGEIPKPKPEGRREFRRVEKGVCDVPAL